MKQYKLQFYKRRNDWQPTATYYREFEGYKQMIDWCNDMQTSCRYNRYFWETVSIDKFLQNS